MTTVDEVLDLYRRFGQEPYDEGLPQVDHALQTAAHAVAAGAPDPTIVAALLHDVGHLLDLRGDAIGAHERVGRDFLAHLFPTSVTDPIALHVEAKRYLCAVDPGYRGSLSAGSTASLERQGGPMTDDEAEAFAASPNARIAVELRRWDDLGKVEGQPVPELASYEALLREVACSGS